VLVHALGGRRTAGVIVEAEAYIGEDDPACHAAPGPTTRNAPLYGEPGRAYVYLNYGMHYLVNAVTEREGFPAAVLIRALDPSRPGPWPPACPGGEHRHCELCRGPGNLKALSISPRTVFGWPAASDRGLGRPPGGLRPAHRHSVGRTGRRWCRPSVRARAG
jgi:DNA-3-methyladenine glycosylase